MTDLKVYGAPWCPDCKRAKKFLAEHRIAYDWVDIDAELAAKLGITLEATRRAYDLVIIGGGPTGLAAAIYAAREGIEALVVDKSASVARPVSPNASTTTRDSPRASAAPSWPIGSSHRRNGTVSSSSPPST